jgi:hypothetical protein
MSENTVENANSGEGKVQLGTSHFSVYRLKVLAKIAWWMLKCAASIIQHKYFVFKAGVLTRTSWWRLLKHDLSKFGPKEWYGYSRNWHGDKGDEAAWQRAWLHHQNVNDHHWQYWVEPGAGDGFMKAHPMPIEAVRELVADWIGATRTHTGVWVTKTKEWPWLVQNLPKISRYIHPETQERLVEVLFEIDLISVLTTTHAPVPVQPSLPLGRCDCGTHWNRNEISPDQCPDCGKPVVSAA